MEHDLRPGCTQNVLLVEVNKSAAGPSTVIRTATQATSSTIPLTPTPKAKRENLAEKVKHAFKQ